MSTTAKIITGSISEAGIRLTTLVLEYPRIIHSEVLTHRMFSRNASSSRAIPVEKQIERVGVDGFIPSQFGKNKKGMQADINLNSVEEEAALLAWMRGKQEATVYAARLANLGVHKQLANRLLEPFSHIQVVVTATEWDNFFLQRLDKNAQPEIQELAKVMKEAMDNSKPKLLKPGEWHLPFINEANNEDLRKFHSEWKDNEKLAHLSDIPGFEILKMISVARCARVSYGLNERGWGDIEKDLALYDMLLTNNHWSPFEHQATPMQHLYDDQYTDFGLEITTPWETGITHMKRDGELWSNNFKGWIQNRVLLQDGN